MWQHRVAAVAVVLHVTVERVDDGSRVRRTDPSSLAARVHRKAAGTHQSRIVRPEVYAASRAYVSAYQLLRLLDGRAHGSDVRQEGGLLLLLGLGGFLGLLGLVVVLVVVLHCDGVVRTAGHCCLLALLGLRRCHLPLLGFGWCRLLLVVLCLIRCSYLLLRQLMLLSLALRCLDWCGPFGWRSPLSLRTLTRLFFSLLVFLPRTACLVVHHRLLQLLHLRHLVRIAIVQHDHLVVFLVCLGLALLSAPSPLWAADCCCSSSSRSARRAAAALCCTRVIIRVDFFVRQCRLGQLLRCHSPAATRGHQASTVGKEESGTGREEESGRIRLASFADRQHGCTARRAIAMRNEFAC